MDQLIGLAVYIPQLTRRADRDAHDARGAGGQAPQLLTALEVIGDDLTAAVVADQQPAVAQSDPAGLAFCAPCHQLEHRPSEGLDPERWPGGSLPVHSTYAEWESGPINPGAPCQSCHMPPDPDVGNAADLGVYVEADPNLTGITGGWWREPGTVRRHTFSGPRRSEDRLLQLAAAVDISASQESGELAVQVTVSNLGPGHALPTGEPLRSLVLLVEATCDGAPLEPTGGDVVPDFGGWRQRKLSGEDWTRWPGAVPGDVIRVIDVPADA